MADQSYFLLSRGFLVNDTWVVFFIFTAFAVSMLNLGFMITGKRRRWDRSGNTHPDDRGAGRGPHRMSWKTIYATQFVSFMLTSISQFFSVTDASACTFDAAAVHKTCDARSSVTAFLYFINMFLMAFYVATFLTHARDFFWALVLRALVFSISVAQFGLYVSLGDVPGAVFQGLAVGLDVFNIYLSWSGRRQSFLRLERRLVVSARDLAPEDIVGTEYGGGGARAASSESAARRKSKKHRSSRKNKGYDPV